MRVQVLRGLLIGAAAATLAACGGGGGGVNSTPFVPAPPTPPPPPPPPPTDPSSVIPPGQIGLVGAEPFAVLGVGHDYISDASGYVLMPVSGPSAQDIQFSYDPSTNSYQISLPGFQSGTLANTGYGGTVGQVATSSTSQVTAGSSTALQPVFVTLPVPGSSFSPYTYTSFGSWNGNTGTSSNGDILRSRGMFAYGIPTAPGAVPISGSASYQAAVAGHTLDGNYYVQGTASLQFDFGAGTLAGHFDPTIHPLTGMGEGYSVGRYDFVNTVFGVGSTSFSGMLSQTGVAGQGTFNGLFTGPSAQELMARWTAPYVNPLTQGTGSMFGVWIGKKN